MWGIKNGGFPAKILTCAKTISPNRQAKLPVEKSFLMY